MTLALYGKSRRRQLSLLALALFAVLAATLGGARVFQPGAASAAETAWTAPTTTPSGSCGDSSERNNAYGTGSVACSDGQDAVYAGFGISLPANAIVDGIEVNFDQHTSNNNGTDGLNVSLDDGDGSFTSEEFQGTEAESPWDNDTAGGTSDTWGRAWSVAEIATLRVRVEAVTGGTQTFDNILVRVTYTVSVQTYIDQLDDHNGPTVLPPNVCAAADFNFVVDISGSVESGELTQVKTAMTAFGNTYQGGGGDGRYSITTFGDGTATTRTAGFVNQTGFNTGIAAIPASGNGRTPTATGISTALGNNAGDRGGVGNIMIIITDGSPNQPPANADLNNPATWVNAANSAITQANTARGSYHVLAAYIGTPDASLNGAMPGGQAEADQFAEAVMTQLGGGTFIPTTFATLANDILISSGCEPDTGTLTIKKMLWNGQAYVANADNTWGFRYATLGTTYANATPVNNGQTVTGLALGQYAAFESVPAGYELTGFSVATSENGTCPPAPMNDIDPPTVGPATAAVSATLVSANDSNRTVCFFNRPVVQTGTLHIKKWAWDGDSWEVATSTIYDFLADGATDYVYDGPGSKTVDAGTYTVSETSTPPNTHLAKIQEAASDTACTPPQSPNDQANPATVSSTVPAGGTRYVCAYNAPNPPQTVTINAYKIVCETEADLPNWGDGMPEITPGMATFFVENSGGDCWFVDGWEFEWGDGDLVSNPGDNNDGTALADFTTTTSASDNTVPTGQTPASVTIDISQYNHLWAREKKPAGWLNFSGDTTAPRDNVSAEFYCSDDVVNYDNWERIEDNSGAHDLTAGSTYYCIGFNVDVRPGFVEVHKVVTNVDNDPTVFDFVRAEPQAGFTLTEAQTTTQQVNSGPLTVTETAEPGYNTLGWARIFGGETCPASMPAGPGGVVIEASAAGDNSAEVTIAPNNTTVLCFYNELSRGDIIIEKYVWNGETYERFDDAEDPFLFEILPLDQGGTNTHSSVPQGTYEVVRGAYQVGEHDPSASGYVLDDIIWGDGECPAAPNEQQAPAQVLEGDSVDIDVNAGGTELVCAYNSPVGRLIVNKINNTSGPVEGPFTFAISTEGGPVLGGASAGLSEVYSKVVPLGSYTVTELGIGTFEQCPQPNPNGTGTYQTNPTPVQVIDEPGETITFNITNEDCPTVLGTGTLVVEKHLDIDGTPAPGDPLLQWTVTVTGPEFPGGQQFVLDGTGSSPAVGQLVLPGIKTGPYTVTEAAVPGYAQTGLIVNGVAQGVNASAGVTISFNETDLVQYYNQPRGSIRVDKVTLEAGTPINERGGWAITVSGCGVNRAGSTNAAGTVVFNDLPACAAGYTVSENPNSKVGFVATTGSVRNNVVVVINQTTEVQFINERTCTTNCGTVTPTPTPTTPTPTTPTITTTPAETPSPNTPTPIDTVAGEITPGGGALATPIAPSAGSGLSGTASSIAMLLVVLGLLAISSGATILTVARRR